MLSKHPDVARRVRAEVDEVIQGREPAHDDIPNLRYTDQVLKETLRLYPPLWTVARSPVADDVVDGYRVPAGGTVILSSYVTHRHLDFWDNPEGFDPDRFAPERSEGRHKYSYIPFGGGPRGCIGFPFAMLELNLVLPRIVQHFALSLVPGHPVVHESAISLRQKYGALMRLERL